MTDRQLLAEYAKTAGQDAFAAIVERHSAMVYSVCLRVLGDRHAAEDTVQTTFLILIKKSRSLPPDTVLPGWLYLTAHMAALEMRRSLARSARRQKEAATMDRGPSDELWAEVRPKLDTALASLPSVQRDALVLRYINGKSETEAAQELGCPIKTLHSRVTRGLATLREKLRRAGTAVPSMTLADFLGQRGIETAPAGLNAAVSAVCVGKSAAAPLVVQTVHAALKAMFWMKVKLYAGIAVAVLSLSLPVVAVLRPTPPPVVTMVCATARPVIGQTITVSVDIRHAPRFANWGSYLQFDPSRLQLTAQAAGTFSTFVPDARGLAEINATGQVHLGGYSLTGNAGGDGTLAVLTFKAVAAGATHMTSGGMLLSDSFGNVIQKHGDGNILPELAGPLSITIGGGN